MLIAELMFTFKIWLMIVNISMTWFRTIVAMAIFASRLFGRRWLC